MKLLHGWIAAALILGGSGLVVSAEQQIVEKQKTVSKNDKIDIEDEEITKPESETVAKGKLTLLSKTFTPPNKDLFLLFPNTSTHVDIASNLDTPNAERRKDTNTEIKVRLIYPKKTTAANPRLRCEGNLSPTGKGTTPPELHWSVKTQDSTVNLTIFISQGGIEVPEDKEETVGSFTVANLNDTDADSKVDNGDDTVKTPVRDEVDLMKLIIGKPSPDNGGNVTLTIEGKAKLWEKSTKETEVKERSFQTTDLPKTVWVEATDISKSVRDIVITETYENASDTVKATGVWAKKTDFKNKLTDKLWADAGDPLKTTFTGTYGGKFGIQFGAPPVNVQYAMGMEFTVYPSGIGAEPGIVFDITRQIESRDWCIDGKTVTEQRPWNDFPSGDTSNDDSLDPEGNQSDEDNTPQNDHIYVIDGPGEPNDGKHDQVISRNNFFEFARVRFDGAALNGNNSDGSRCSDKVKWHAFYWIEKNGAAYKQRPGKTNEVKEGHLAINPAPLP